MFQHLLFMTTIWLFFIPFHHSFTPPFSVYKNQILDSMNEMVNIQGVSKSGFEYLYLDVHVFTNTSILYDIQLMKEWNINTVRFPLRDIYWEISEYQKIIHYFIDQLWEQEIISIIDLHTQGSSYGLDPFLQRKPSGMYDAMQFWKDIVISFAHKEYVWFELFNEPFQISPDTWWEGNESYYGYRDMILTIREVTPRIVLLGGLDYAYQWNFLQYHPSIKEELLSFDNIVLTTHPYGYKGRPVQNGTETDPIPIHIISVQEDEIMEGDCSLGYTLPSVSLKEYGWNESFGYLLDDFPIIFTEFGLDRVDTALQGGWYMMELMEYLRFHPNIGWIAWAWVRERLDYPSLLQENFLPTGIARYITKGPACAVVANQFYPGPGLLIYNYLRDHSQTQRTMMESLPKNSSMVFSPMFSFSQHILPFFFLILAVSVLFILVTFWIHKRAILLKKECPKVFVQITTYQTTMVESRPFLRLRSIRSLDSII